MALLEKSSMYLLTDLDEEEEDEVDEEEQENQEVYPWFTSEIMESIEDFQLGERQERGNDSFVPVTFRGKRCQIQTPPVMVMFGLTSYAIPNEKEKKYSLHLSLRPTSPEMVEFARFLRDLDQWAKDYQIDTKHKYWSSIRENHKDVKNKSPVLRLKVNSNAHGLILDIITTKGEMVSLPKEVEFKSLVKHHTIIKAIIEVNPVWYAGNKYGVSYRLLKIMIVNKPKPLMTFRPD